MIPRVFPYKEPRLQQLKIWEFLKNLEDVNTSIIEAPTGVGKTAAVLAYLLENYDKIIWFTFTKRERKVVLREARKMNIDYMELRSLSDCCPLKEVREAMFPKQKCLFLRYYGKCPFILQCPYDTQFLATREKRLIVLCQAWLHYFEKVRDIIEESSVIVFDEAHHIVLPQEISIASRDFVLKAFKECSIGVKGTIVEKMLREKVLEVDENEIRYLRELGEKIVYRSGQSYLYELADRLDFVAKVFYDKKTKEYCGVVDVYPRLREIMSKKKVILISATFPKPYVEIVRRLSSCVADYRVREHCFDFYTIIHANRKLPKRKWGKRTLEYIEVILETVSKYFPRILVVFPSSDLLSKYTRVAELPFNSEVIIAGSREAEGITIKAQCVVVLGVPYARITRGLIELMKILKKYTKKPRLAGYIAPAVIRAIQACGRVLRNNATVVLVDKRWIKLKPLMPTWFRKPIKEITKGVDQLEERVAYYSCLT